MSRLLTEAVVVKMTSSQAPKAPQMTHFLCIPLVTPTSRLQLAGNLAAFQDDVTRPKSLGGFQLPADVVRPLGTLHLTLGMMSFPKDEGLDKAVGVLHSLDLRGILAGLKEGEQEAVAGAESPLCLTLKGLHSMQKPDKATILYAQPLDPLGTLQEFSERVRAPFKEQGLLVADHRPLLLHATIVNTIYVKTKREARRGKKRDRNVIDDAQAILDRYEDHAWMQDVPLEKVVICRMGAKPVVKDGEVVDVAYEEEGAICW